MVIVAHYSAFSRTKDYSVFVARERIYAEDTKGRPPSTVEAKMMLAYGLCIPPKSMQFSTCWVITPKSEL